MVDALQTVGAAGDFRDLVGDLAHDQRDPERHHEPREVRAAQDEKAGRKAEHGGGKAGGDQRQHRLVDDRVLGEQRRHVGAEAEKGGMPERHDPGIAQNEIERERKQRKPGDLGEDQVAAGQQEYAASAASQNTISADQRARVARWRAASVTAR